MPLDNTGDPVELVTKHLEQFTTATKAQLDEAKKALTEANARITELEQKGARHGDTPGGGRESWGSEFIRSKAAEVRGIASARGRVSLEMKATITSDPLGGSPAQAGSAGALTVPVRDMLVGMPRRRMTVRQLLTVVPVDSGNLVEYASQATRTNNAAPVAEAALKPESDLSFDLLNAPIRTIAHWMLASRQILADAPQLGAFIDGELRYGLMLEEEDQILNGPGTGQNLAGIIPAATAFSSPFGGSPPYSGSSTMLDIIAAAILQASLTEIPPDGIVVHPSDFWRMRLLKNTDGEYIMGPPSVVAPPVLFGLPAVLTQSMAVDKFLVGAFSEQTLYDRQTATVEISTEDSDNFRKNLVTLLGEERIGLAVKRPTAMIYGDFGNG